MKIRLRILILFVGSLFFLSLSKPAFAEPPMCSSMYPGFNVSNSWPSTPIVNTEYAPLSLQISGVPVGTYKINCSMDSQGLSGYRDYGSYPNIQTTGNVNGRGDISWTVNDDSCFTQQSGLARDSDWNLYLKIEPQNDPSKECRLLNYTLKGANNRISCNASNFQFIDSSGLSGCYESGETISWRLDEIKYQNGNLANGSFWLHTSNSTADRNNNIFLSNGSATGNVTLGEAGKNFTVQFKEQYGQVFCSASVDVFVENTCNPEDKVPPGTITPSTLDLCSQADPKDYEDCHGCTNDVNHIWTAVGCIPTSYQGITSTVIKIGLSVAGGVALLMIISAAFTLTTSQGEPKAATEAKEQLTAAVVGLLFIIFSVTILQFIGVSLLRLPGFGQ